MEQQNFHIQYRSPRFFTALTAAACALLLCLSVSCSDSVPRLSAVRCTVIFDYAAHNSLPQMRLAVFVQPLSDAARVKNMEIIHIESGLVWQISEVRFAGNGVSLWAGAPNMVPVHNELIPAGAYEVIYTDAAERFTQSRFTVQYPVLLAKTRADAVRTVLGPAVKEKITLYSEAGGLGTVLYCGPEKKEWQDTSRLLMEYPDTASYRKSVETPDIQVICILPPETLKRQ